MSACTKERERDHAMLMMSEHLCTLYLLHSFHHWAAAVFTSSSAFFSRENVALPGVALYFKVLEFLDHPQFFVTVFLCFFSFLAAELFRFAMLVAKALSVVMAKLWPYKFAAMEKFLRVLKRGWDLMYNHRKDCLTDPLFVNSVSERNRLDVTRFLHNVRSMMRGWWLTSYPSVVLLSSLALLLHLLLIGWRTRISQRFSSPLSNLLPSSR